MYYWPIGQVKLDRIRPQLSGMNILKMKSFSMYENSVRALGDVRHLTAHVIREMCQHAPEPGSISQLNYQPLKQENQFRVFAIIL